LEIKFISRRSASNTFLFSDGKRFRYLRKIFRMRIIISHFTRRSAKFPEYLWDFAAALTVARKITRCTSIFYPIDCSVFTITEKYVCAKIRSDNRYCKSLHRSRRTLCIRNLYRFFFREFMYVSIETSYFIHIYVKIKNLELKFIYLFGTQKNKLSTLISFIKKLIFCESDRWPSVHLASSSY